MFVEAEGIAPIALSSARVALDRAVQDGGLVLESRRACDEAASFVMRVRAGDRFGIAKQVLVKVLPARDVAGVFTLPFRWEATGPASRLFPTLDADLTLAAAEGDCTLVTVRGSYRVPLGRVGDALDESLLSGIADCTMAALVREVIAKLVHLSS